MVFIRVASRTRSERRTGGACLCACVPPHRRLQLPAPRELEWRPAPVAYAAALSWCGVVHTPTRVCFKTAREVTLMKGVQEVVSVRHDR